MEKGLNIEFKEDCILIPENLMITYEGNFCGIELTNIELKFVARYLRGMAMEDIKKELKLSADHIELITYYLKEKLRISIEMKSLKGARNEW